MTEATQTTKRKRRRGRPSPPEGQPQRRTAAKVHQCTDCGGVIRKGDPYDYIRWRDWWEQDVDDDGRTISILLPRDQRRWAVHKLCIPCSDKRYAEEMM